jgi:hypothetical protein
MNIDLKQAMNDARLMAKHLNKAIYVTYTADGVKWIVAETQPHFTQSHWRLDPDGRCWAHLAEKSANNWHYEESKL